MLGSPGRKNGRRRKRLTMLLVNRFRASSLLGLVVVVALSAAMNFSVSRAHYVQLSTTILASEELFVMNSVHEASTNLQDKEGGTVIDHKARMSYIMKGRKMMMERKKEEKDVITKKEEVKKELDASKISGANYSVGKCEHKKEGETSTIGSRLSPRSNKSNLLPFKTNVGGRHISLNADYHVPRPHPPKNN